MSVAIKLATQPKVVREVKALRTADRKRAAEMNHCSCHSCNFHTPKPAVK